MASLRKVSKMPQKAGNTRKAGEKKIIMRRNLKFLKRKGKKMQLEEHEDIHGNIRFFS